jgi:hypothetical protein
MAAKRRFFLKGRGRVPALPRIDIGLAAWLRQQWAAGRTAMDQYAGWGLAF